MDAEASDNLGSGAGPVELQRTCPPALLLERRCGRPELWAETGL